MEPRIDSTRRRPRPAAIVWSAVALAFVVLTFRPVVEGDGVGYYSYLHAVVVTRSLGFATEYAAAVRSHMPLYEPLVSTRDPNGHLLNFFPIGPALLSLPGYLAALAFEPSGEPQFGSPFVEAFTLASLLYGLLALALCFRLATSVIPDRRAEAIGVVATAVATPLLYYLLSDPSYSHTFSVFCVSAFLYAWWRGVRSPAGWFALGVLGGVMALTRYQDGVLVAIVLIDARRLRWPALLFLPGLLAGFSPQLAVDQVQFGSLLPLRPPGQALDPLHGHYLSVLFSSSDGLLIWTPAALLAAIGVAFIPDRRLKAACILAAILEFLVVSAAPDSVGRAFGARRFLELAPFAAIAIGALFARIHRAWYWVLALAATAWNLLLIANFEYVLNSSGTVTYGALLRGQLLAPAYVPRLFTKGAVVRDLALWGPAGVSFNPGAGMALLAAEAACLALAAFVAVRSRRGRIGAPAPVAGKPDRGLIESA